MLERVANDVMNIDRPFLLEVILNREPTDAEVDQVVEASNEECSREAGSTRDMGDLGRILVKTGEPSIVVPSVVNDDAMPRMALARALVGPSALNRQVIVRVPFQDQRAEDILRGEARQLPKGECGLIMVNVNSQPTAFEYWSQRIPQRFSGNQHTRVAGVILFMHATQLGPRGLVWIPHVRVIPNPNAAVPLPLWITAEVDRIRADARNLAGR
jgi:hypothetical protein